MLFETNLVDPCMQKLHLNQTRVKHNSEGCEGLKCLNKNRVLWMKYLEKWALGGVSLWLCGLDVLDQKFLKGKVYISTLDLRKMWHDSRRNYLYYYRFKEEMTEYGKMVPSVL